MYWNTHFFPSLSTSHILTSTLKSFCCLLILGNIITFHPKQFKTFNKHHRYNIFEKFSSFIAFRLWPHAALPRDTNNRGRFFYLPYIIPIECLHWYSFHKLGFKIAPVVLLCPNMHLLVEDVMYVSQDEIPMSGGYVAYQLRCAWCMGLPRGLMNKY